MSQQKKQIRKQFRDSVYARDRYTCVACGFCSSPEKAEQELDAHHITSRDDMPNGGYVAENGASLCKHGNPSCHERAESGEIAADELYRKIGSSYEQALTRANKLGG